MKNKKKLFTNEFIRLMIAIFFGNIIKSIVEGLIGFNLQTSYKILGVFSVEDVLIYFICSIFIYILLHIRKIIKSKN